MVGAPAGVMTQRLPGSRVPSGNRLPTATTSTAPPEELDTANSSVLLESSTPTAAYAAAHTDGLAARLVTLTLPAGVMAVTLAVADACPVQTGVGVGAKQQTGQQASGPCGPSLSVRHPEANRA